MVFEKHRPTNKFLNPKCHWLYENENLLSDRRGKIFQPLNAIIPLKFPKKWKFSFLFEMTGEKTGRSIVANRYSEQLTDFPESQRIFTVLNWETQTTYKMTESASLHINESNIEETWYYLIGSSKGKCIGQNMSGASPKLTTGSCNLVCPYPDTHNSVTQTLSLDK